MKTIFRDAASAVFWFLVRVLGRKEVAVDNRWRITSYRWLGALYVAECEPVDYGTARELFPRQAILNAMQNLERKVPKLGANRNTV